MKLYEINNTLRAVIEQGYSVDTDTGEILFETEDLEQLESDRAEKLLACAKVIKEMTAYEKALTDEKKTLDVRIKVQKRKREYLEKYVLTETQEGEKFEDSQAVLSFRKSKALVVDCEIDRLPAMYRTEKVTISADKKLIKQNITSLAEFAHIEERRNVSIK